MAQTLVDKIKDRTATIAIIGLGYVGLPLAGEMAKAGFRVYGIDIDGDRVDTINGGRSYIDDVSDADLAALVASGALVATEDPGVVKEVDAVVICVPTPLTRA